MNKTQQAIYDRKRKDEQMSQSRKRGKQRTVRSFHPDTLSIPSDETIGVLEGKVIYTEVIDAQTGDSLGVPNMAVVRETMRPTKDSRCRNDGEYYIANFRTPEEQEAYDQKLAAEPFSWK